MVNSGPNRKLLSTKPQRRPTLSLHALRTRTFTAASSSIGTSNSSGTSSSSGLSAVGVPLGDAKSNAMKAKYRLVQRWCALSLELLYFFAHKFTPPPSAVAEMT